VNYDNSLVVTITVTCCSWAPSSVDHLFTFYRPPHVLLPTATRTPLKFSTANTEPLRKNCHDRIQPINHSTKL